MPTESLVAGKGPLVVLAAVRLFALVANDCTRCLLLPCGSDFVVELVRGCVLLAV